MLIPLLASLTARRQKGELLTALEAAGVPAGPINDIGEVFADPQVIARGIRAELPSAAAKAGAIPTVASPIVIDGVRQVAGQPKDEILNDPTWSGRHG